MKKFLVIIMSIVCILGTTVYLTACDTYDGNSGAGENITEVIDLANCEIGYELPVYPNCEFDYKVSDDCTVHITKFTVTLVEKTEIQPNQVIENPLSPYLVNINVNGTTSIDNYGRTLTLRLQYTESSIMSLSATVDEEGNLYWYQAEKMLSVHRFYFVNIIV